MPRPICNYAGLPPQAGAEGVTPIGLRAFSSIVWAYAGCCDRCAVRACLQQTFARMAKVATRPLAVAPYGRIARLRRQFFAQPWSGQYNPPILAKHSVW